MIQGLTRSARADAHIAAATVRNAAASTMSAPLSPLALTVAKAWAKPDLVAAAASWIYPIFSFSRAVPNDPMAPLAPFVALTLSPMVPVRPTAPATNLAIPPTDTALRSALKTLNAEPATVIAPATPGIFPAVLTKDALNEFTISRPEPNASPHSAIAGFISSIALIWASTPSFSPLRNPCPKSADIDSFTSSSCCWSD